MEEKIIKFVPDVVIKNITTIDMSRAINANLRELIPNYEGARIVLKNNAISIEILFRPSEETVIDNPIARTGIKTDSPFTIKDELKNKLGDFINVNAPLHSDSFEKKHKTYIMFKLNPQKTINTILEKCPEGYHYEIGSILPAEKSNYGIIQFCQMKNIDKKPEENNRQNNNR